MNNIKGSHIGSSNVFLLQKSIFLEFHTNITHLICLEGFTTTNNFLMVKLYKECRPLQYMHTTYQLFVSGSKVIVIHSLLTEAYHRDTAARFQPAAGDSKNRAGPVVTQIWWAVWGLNLFTIHSHVITYSIMKTRKIWVTILKPFIELHGIISWISFTICS